MPVKSLNSFATRWRGVLALLVVLCAMWASDLIQASLAQDQGPSGQPPQAAVKPEEKSLAAPSLSLDKTKLENGGTLKVSGKALPGNPVYLEVWSQDEVRASRFDSDLDKDGNRPYILYLSERMPAFYRILVPVGLKDKLDALRKEGPKWSYSEALKILGADDAYSAPAKIEIDRYQATFLGGIVGSRGEQLAKMDDKENRRRSMQLVKARFRSPGKVLAPAVEIAPDGQFSANLTIDPGLAPGKYFVAAVSGKDARSATLSFENEISFPMVYLSNAGTSLNLFWPFLLALGVGTFGVLMGAGGGFLLNPLLLTFWPLPHTIVAGTVMPTILFSQASGIYNYSKIKFINWRLGLTLGAASLCGGFIGPKLTELITLDQYKFVFGWILVVLAALMFWQTTPMYLERNKKEQAVLRECKRLAEEAAKSGKGAPACKLGEKE